LGYTLSKLVEKAVGYHTSKLGSASFDTVVAGDLSLEHAAVDRPVEAIHKQVVDFVKNHCAKLHRVVRYNCLECYTIE